MASSLSHVEQAIEKLEDQLNCAICMEPHEDPKLLNCFHVFCMKCLQPLVQQSDQGQTMLCPNCPKMESRACREPFASTIYSTSTVRSSKSWNLPNPLVTNAREGRPSNTVAHVTSSSAAHALQPTEHGQRYLRMKSFLSNS